MSQVIYIHFAYFLQMYFSTIITKKCNPIEHAYFIEPLAYHKPFETLKERNIYVLIVLYSCLHSFVFINFNIK